jgi:hypothetical protein
MEGSVSAELVTVVVIGGVLLALAAVAAARELMA